MAGVLTTDISDHLTTQFPQVVVDAVERKSELLALFSHKTVTGGNGPEWRVNYAGNSSAGSFGEGDSEPVAGKQSYLKAKMSWRGIWAVLRLSRSSLEEAQNAYLVGDLYQEELNRTTLDLTEEAEDQVRSDGTGNGGKDIDGIQAAISSSGTYASIAKATYTWWQAYISSGVGTLAMSDLKTASLNLRSATRKSRWDLILAGPTVWNIYGDLIEAEGGKKVHSVSQAAELQGLKYEGGYTSLGFEGKPVLDITGYTAQRMDFVQRSDFEIHWIRQFLVDAPKIEGDDITFKITARLNLRCLHCGRQGALTGITG